MTTLDDVSDLLLLVASILLLDVRPVLNSDEAAFTFPKDAVVCAGEEIAALGVATAVMVLPNTPTAPPAPRPAPGVKLPNVLRPEEPIPKLTLGGVLVRFIPA